jgi:hypothetical protein
MSDIISKLNKNELNSFWLEEPSFKLTNEFSTLYDEDNSSNKKDSSLKMWAIALLTETKGNKLSKLPIEQRRVDINSILDIEIDYLSLQP